MTTNKPGSETQQPLFGCASCYEYVSYPADHLRVYSGECWCEGCWDEATHEIADGRDWGELEPFKPALQAECDTLVGALEWLRGAINCTPENDRHQSGAWIGTEHPMIKRIDGLIAAHRKHGGDA